MDKIIKIPDAHVDHFIALFEQIQESLQRQIQVARAELHDLEVQYQNGLVAIEVLKSGNDPDLVENPLVTKDIWGNTIEQVSFAYPEKGSWWDKILWVLGKKQKVLSATEITEAIYLFQPELVEGTPEYKLAGVNVHSTLSNKIKDKRLARIKSDDGYKYGLNEWFDENDELIEKYDNVNSEAKL